MRDFSIGTAVNHSLKFARNRRNGKRFKGFCGVMPRCPRNAAPPTPARHFLPTISSGGTDMNTASRAHRILRTMANYHGMGITQETRSRDAIHQFGNAIGVYRNHKSSLFIYEDGIDFAEENSHTLIRFSEITHTHIPEGKTGESVRITMRNGTQHHLPIEGQNGQFRDALEMLRFIDRVIQDQSKDAHP